MDWDRSQTIALAKTGCSHCHGYGLRIGRNEAEVPCNCVFRAIFRACYARFKQCVNKDRSLSHVQLEICCSGKDNRISYGRKTEEYIADFCLVSKNALTSLEYDIFRFHYLLGADWKLCSWRLQLDRGTFFHLIYKIEQKLGRVFRELQPHSLFPLDEYFGGTMRNDRPAVALIPKPPSPHVLRPPIGLSAA